MLNMSSKVDIPSQTVIKIRNSTPLIILEAKDLARFSEKATSYRNRELWSVRTQRPPKHQQLSWLFEASQLTEDVKKTWGNFSRGSSSNSSFGGSQRKQPFSSAVKGCFKAGALTLVLAWAVPQSSILLIQALANFPVWQWACLTSVHLAGYHWSWSFMLQDPDSVSQLDTRPTFPIADLLGVLVPGLNPATLTGTVYLSWGTVRLVHGWQTHCFYWPPFPEGTALPLLHISIELQQFKLATSIRWETKT